MSKFIFWRRFIMIKRIVAVAIAVMMIAAMAAVSVSAASTADPGTGAEVSNSAGADTASDASGAGNVVMFDAGKWGANVKTVYCHIWVRGGDSFWGWQAKAEACTKKSGTVWQYDLSKLNNSTYVEGGLKSDTDYCIIFSADTGAQTYDQTFGTACIGDTAKMTGKMIENAVDSEKEAYESVWSTNSSKYGPHLAISSIGNIIGSVLCPNESGAEVIGDWLPTYYNSPNVKATDTLAKALPKFGVKDIQAVYAYILSKETDGDTDAMLKILENAYAKAYPNEEKKTIDKDKAEKQKDAIENGEDISDISTDDGGSDGSTGGDTTGGSDSSYSGGGDSSGSGSDGQEDTIFFVLVAVMLAAAGVMFVSRKREN